MHERSSPARDKTEGVGRSARTWLFLLLGLGLLIRVLLLLSYAPVEYGDTGSYLRLGEAVLGIGERGFDGTRVPGYPIFMALFNLDPARIWLGQMVLGLSISLMLFYVASRVTGSAALGFTFGALYDLIPGQILFEANMLTETLTTSLIVLTVFLFAVYVGASSRGRRHRLLLLLGLAAALAGMVRPLFFPITLLIAAFVWAGFPGTVRSKLLAIAIYSIFPLLIQGGWLVYMRSHWKVLSPTAMAGYSMVQHTGGYFEYLPDEDAAIRDTYIEYRDRQIAERGVQTNAIWEAIPAISSASGLGFYDLSREMSRLSWMLIREHPVQYLRNVVKGWVDFWKAPVYWKPELFTSSFMSAGVGALAVAGRALSVLANFTFLLISASWLVVRRVRSWIRMDAVMGLSTALVWMISIVQALLDHGDNPRFLVPLQMLVFLVVIVGLNRVNLTRKVAQDAP